MAKKAPAEVASFHPDQLTQGGLASDFDGTIVKVRLVPWDYDGRIDHDVLAVAVDIEPDADSGEEAFTQHYSAGDLAHFVPSMDGKEPVDLDEGEGEELEGIYAFKVGTRSGISLGSNWGFFISKAIDAGFPASEIGSSVDCFEGVTGHFNRINQPKRNIPGQVQEDGEAKRNDILVLTDVASTDGAAVTEDAEPEAEGGGLAEQVAEAIWNAMPDDEPMAKSDVAQIVMKAGFKGAEKKAAVKMATDLAFLSGDVASEYFEYDEEEDTLTAVE